MTLTAWLAANARRSSLAESRSRSEIAKVPSTPGTGTDRAEICLFYFLLGSSPGSCPATVLLRGASSRARPWFFYNSTVRNEKCACDGKKAWCRVGFCYVDGPSRSGSTLLPFVKADQIKPRAYSTCKRAPPVALVSVVITNTCPARLLGPAVIHGVPAEKRRYY